MCVYMYSYIHRYLVTQKGITLIAYKTRSVLRKIHFCKPEYVEETRALVPIYSNPTWFGTVRVPIWEANQGL